MKSLPLTEKAICHSKFNFRIGGGGVMTINMRRSMFLYMAYYVNMIFNIQLFCK